mgnify:CR=1 FL=1
MPVDNSPVFRRDDDLPVKRYAPRTMQSEFGKLVKPAKAEELLEQDQEATKFKNEVDNVYNEHQQKFALEVFQTELNRCCQCHNYREEAFEMAPDWYKKSRYSKQPMKCTKCDKEFCAQCHIYMLDWAYTKHNNQDRNKDDPIPDSMS